VVIERHRFGNIGLIRMQTSASITEGVEDDLTAVFDFLRVASADYRAQLHQGRRTFQRRYRNQLPILSARQLIDRNRS
jgi:hypothetical protein